jgi:alpha-L-fucosidase
MGSMDATDFPAVYGAVPSVRQLRWHRMEVYGFIHFSINTFTDKEWGYGDESPTMFDPSEFDAGQIVRVARDAGLRGLVLTCKHHDGFCLWPSQSTEHSVKNSPWKGGGGDVVWEISEACRSHGLKFGVYLSPWDRNHADYGAAAYVEYYRAQLRELLTGYGPIFEVWFDGANGGDGYYGGARETRNIDNRTYYDWDNTWEIVRELQPDACIFTDRGPDTRWCGNESGYAGDPCWSTLNIEEIWPGHADHNYLNRGDRTGTEWLPAEVDVSTRPGWFYHAAEDEAVKSLAKLRQIYFESVGRGANLILNIPPDRRGLIHENDAVALVKWRQHLDETFATNLALGAKAEASHTRGSGESFGAEKVLDGDDETFWSIDDGVTVAELILDLAQPSSFNVVRLREYLPLGQRVDRFALDAWNEGEWREIGMAQAIGNCRLVTVPEVTTSRVRLRITEAAACPAISEFGLFLMPELEEESAAMGAIEARKWTVVSFEAFEVVGKLDEMGALKGFRFLPRQDGKLEGTPERYEFYVSPDGENWGDAMEAGEFSNIRANPILQVRRFEREVKGAFFRFVGVRVVGDEELRGEVEVF